MTKLSEEEQILVRSCQAHARSSQFSEEWTRAKIEQLLQANNVLCRIIDRITAQGGDTEGGAPEPTPEQTTRILHSIQDMVHAEAAPDEIAEIEKRHEGCAYNFETWIENGKNPDDQDALFSQAHRDRGTLLQAIRRPQPAPMG